MSLGPVALAMISTGVGVAGAVMQGRAQQQAYSYQAAVAARNAQIAKQNAARESERGQIEAQDNAETAAQELGELLARQSTAGVLDAGSPANYIRAARRLAARDQTRIREDSTARVRGIQQQEADFRGEAAMARSASRMALFETFINVGSTLVDGATSVRKARLGIV